MSACEVSDELIWEEITDLEPSFWPGLDLWLAEWKEEV